VAVQDDGKVVVAGFAGEGEANNHDFVVWRYLPDGTPDSGFSGDGKAVTDFSAARDIASAVAIQGDGKVVVAGTASGYFAVARYDTDGSLDSSFSGDGKALAEFDLGATANDFAIQANGKLVVVGNVRSDHLADFALARYNTDGSLDDSFSEDGKVRTDFGLGYVTNGDRANGVAIQSNGKIVVGGSGGTSYSDNYFAARYNVNGSLDTSFGDGGSTAIDFTEEPGGEGGGGSYDDDYAHDLALQPDGKIVLVGNTTPGGICGCYIGVARLSADGELDPTFGGNGLVRTEIYWAQALDFGYAVEVGADGKIVVGGTHSQYNPIAGEDDWIEDFAVLRYLSNGSLDQGFAGDGVALTDFAVASVDEARDVTLQADSKVVVAGRASNGMGVARYDVDGTLDDSFSDDGYLNSLGETCPNGRLKRLGDTNCDGDVRIAILGDSYIAGEGASEYRPGTDDHSFLTSPDLCHRSEHSWAVRVARELANKPDRQTVDFVGALPDPDLAEGDLIAFLACSGAVTENVDWTDTSTSPPGRGVVQYPAEGWTQLDQLDAVDPASLDLVFLSIGGNDAGFADVIEHCLVTRCAADNAWKEAKLDAIDGGPGSVGDRVLLVATKIRQQAPNAELYQAEYPDPLRPLPPTCGSLTAPGTIVAAVSSGLGLGGAAAGAVTLQVTGGMKVEAVEARWVSETFLARLNARLRATTALSGAHMLGFDDAFNGHPICGAEPRLAHGITAGNDIGVAGSGKWGGGVVGNESFHPTREGYDRLAQQALDQHGIKSSARFGSNPNDAAAPITEYDDPDTLTIRIVGPDADSDVFIASGSGYVKIVDAPHNTVIAVSTFSLGEVVGRGETDADGEATIPIRMPPFAAAGLHHLELWTEDGERIGAAPFPLVGSPGCTGTPDVDGDLLTDACDGDPLDGPGADADGDGLDNAEDSCPLVANPDQADIDDDGEGDPCDPDQGASRFETWIRGSAFPQPFGPPTAPLDVELEPAGPGAVRVQWTPPFSDGGAALSGYSVTVSSAPGAHAVGAGLTELQIGGLASGPVSAVVRGVNAAGAGPAAISDEIAIEGFHPPDGGPSKPGNGVPAVPRPGPVSSPSPSGQAGQRTTTRKHRCRKGRTKRRVRGKVRCVRVKGRGQRARPGTAHSGVHRD
jgi:uncharacterized delta-60 repeat protein